MCAQAYRSADHIFDFFLFFKKIVFYEILKFVFKKKFFEFYWFLWQNSGQPFTPHNVCFVHAPRSIKPLSFHASRQLFDWFDPEWEKDRLSYVQVNNWRALAINHAHIDFSLSVSTRTIDVNRNDSRKKCHRGISDWTFPTQILLHVYAKLEAGCVDDMEHFSID